MLKHFQSFNILFSSSYCGILTDLILFKELLHNIVLYRKFLLCDYQVIQLRKKENIFVYNKICTETLKYTPLRHY